MNKIALLYVLFVIWVYILYVLRKQKLTAFHFMIGSTGFFCFVFITCKDYLAYICTFILQLLLDLVHVFFKYYDIYGQYNMIFINNKDAVISLVIDYECCGVIEVLVALSVILFFPLFRFTQKFIFSVIGFFYVMCSNAIRLLCVSYIIYKYGNNFYYVAHSIVGRIIFYILTIVFYFYMISYQQIKNQKVGKFDYN